MEAPASFPSALAHRLKGDIAAVLPVGANLRTHRLQAGPPAILSVRRQELALLGKHALTGSKSKYLLPISNRRRQRHLRTPLHFSSTYSSQSLFHRYPRKSRYRRPDGRRSRCGEMLKGVENQIQKMIGMAHGINPHAWISSGFSSEKHL